MFRRILSRIFTSGATEVSIDRSSEPVTKSWLSTPNSKERSTIPVSAEVTSNATDQSTSLDTWNQRASKFSLRKSNATQETNNPHPQNEVLDTFTDLQTRRKMTKFEADPSRVNHISHNLGR